MSERRDPKRRRIDNVTPGTFTLNGTIIQEGDTATATASTTAALTPGTGLSGSSFDGSVARTFAVTNVPNALTFGTGLSATPSGTYNGSTARTVAIDSTVATLTGSQVLTNKTLTAPVISTISNTGTTTLFTSTDTVVGKATTDTLTNKTISGIGTGNTISATPSRIRRHTTVNTVLASDATTFIPFATSSAAVGELSTAIVPSDSDTIFTNNAGRTIYVSVTFQAYADAVGCYAIIHRYDSGNTLREIVDGPAGFAGPDMTVTANSLEMAAGDYLRFAIFNTDALDTALYDDATVQSFFTMQYLAG